MSETDDLPCPRCGSTRTLGSLYRKRDAVRRRVEAAAKKRYPPPPPPPKSGGGTKLRPNQILNMTGSTIALSSPVSNSISLSGGSYSTGMGGDVVISAADPNEMFGTVMINDAVLDVCVACGTFYASNARRLGEKLEEEIIKMDPLGALAEIRDPDQ